MRFFLFFLFVISLSGCERRHKIDDHFLVSTFDTNDYSLFFLDNENVMFEIIGPEVSSYLKCGNHIFIIQHPLDNTGRVDTESSEYYVVDTGLDYSDERLKPYSISKSRFEEMLRIECGNKPLKKI